MENEGTSLFFLKIFYDIRGKDLILGIVYFLNGHLFRQPIFFPQHFFIFLFYFVYLRQRDNTREER